MAISSEALLEDIKRLQSSVDTIRIPRKGESREEYVKRKFSYKCIYCHKKEKSKNLRVSVEPCHLVKKHEKVEDILRRYRLTKEELVELNPKVDYEKIRSGTLLNIPEGFKVFANTHGICHCFSCFSERRSLELSHIDYIKYSIRKRRNQRQQITPSLKRRVLARDGYKCVYCIVEFGGTEKNYDLTLDHKTPLMQGGSNKEQNLCACCAKHNKDKDLDNYDEYIIKIKKRKFNRENGIIR